MEDKVNAWTERLTIPTYRIGPPDKNPMFLEKRVYQGSSGVVYPHPVVDRIFDEKFDREYTAVYLENRYLKIMVLPEIGGRVQMALDKTNDYHFVYYNRVIKPALVGLVGPWISGGIEFNWPQHHRPSTFDPVDWHIEKHSDGSITIWCSEIERMFRTKGMHGLRLYPGKAYLEINVQLFNRTSEPQTFLWWANPAVHVHDETQSVFPPDVHAVMDHGKREVSDFPIATGKYYKVNYFPGVDISQYKNIPVPTSYMAYHSDFDFIGNYDHRAQAGMLHVANHHIVPGKKQWTWGNGDFGQAWDQQLTDDDGPYIELMCGAFTDNQPDFSWIHPGEEKRFTQIFMPYKSIGPAKNASKDAVINLEVEGNKAYFGVYLSSPRKVYIKFSAKQNVLFEKKMKLSPDSPLSKVIELPADTQKHDLTIAVIEGDNPLVKYSPLSDVRSDIPLPAIPPPAPHEIQSNEELYLYGLHLEQYRHTTYDPMLYYEEALRRDAYDSRCNNAKGSILYRRGKFVEAEFYFRKAVERLILRNPNPYDGEPYYNLGLSLKMQGRYPEAFEALYKAVWNAAWIDAGYFELARLACLMGREDEALNLAEKALDRNARHYKARHLKIALLRRRGDVDRAIEETAVSLGYDPLEYNALWERFLLRSEHAFHQISQGDVHTCIEIALDYAHAGQWDEAAGILEQTDPGDPMVNYTLGWVYTRSGKDIEAVGAFKQAAELPSDYCFPNRLEDVLILKTAMEMNPDDPLAPYYLGNYWYAHRRYEEAIAFWERACEMDPSFPTVHRNLALAYFNQKNEPQKALKSLETAIELDSQDARLLFELDQLYKKINRPPQERLDKLESFPQLVVHRDDLTIEGITLLNMLGRYEEAFQILKTRNFHPWEGGEGKVTSQWVICLVEMARKMVDSGDYDRAIEWLHQTQAYPDNLGEGKLIVAQENNIFYYLGVASEARGEMERAQAYFEKAAVGLGEPTSARYYNDQPPEMIFYQGLARCKLGQSEDADCIYQKLIDYGQKHLNDEINLDYFAVSLPDFLVFDEDLNRRNQIHCFYMMALGYLGRGEEELARVHFDQVLKLDTNHQGALMHRDLSVCR
jgi:tetratricopeptide (TPR) repeat protein